MQAREETNGQPPEAAAGEQLLEGVGARLLREKEELEKRLREAERLATIGELAARVAHEIRNPLAGIAGAVQVMGRDFPPGSRKERTVREILREVKRLDAFIQDLLVFARPVRPCCQAVAFAELAERARAVLDEHGAFRHLAVRVTDGCPETPLWIDKRLMVSVLRSLVLNAAQSQVRQPQGWIELLRERDAEGRDRVCVLDGGPGFPDDAAERARLFEPFHAGKVRGGGLGLATARKIVEGHGGEIEARNCETGGGMICVTLPPMP